jgi:hypothetical protein
LNRAFQRLVRLREPQIRGSRGIQHAEVLENSRAVLENLSSSETNCQSSMNGTLTAVRQILPKRKNAGSEPSKKNRTTRAARLDAESLKKTTFLKEDWLTP